MSTQVLDWKRLSLQEREREYSPSIDGDCEPHIRAYAELSAAARCAHPPATFRYGRKPSQTLDIFLPIEASSRPPVVVFFHGGYWQKLSKTESAFAAPRCLARGIAYVAADYTLAPKADLDEIVLESRAVLSWLERFANVAGIDQNRIVVAGSSSGAHLAAMTALHSEIVKGAILVSGIYDLEPLIGTSIDAALQLDVASARRNSPLHLELTGFPRTVICWGDSETNQTKRQSRAFADALRARGAVCTELEISGRNHFDVIVDLADPQKELGKHLYGLINSIES
jgi:arylformamidase